MDARATLYGHMASGGAVSGTLAAMVARPDAFDVVVLSWMAVGAGSWPLRDAVTRYVVPDPGTRTIEESERREAARRATYESLGLGRETLRIVDETAADGTALPVPEVYRRAYEAMALPCAMEAAGLQFAPGVQWRPLARRKGYDEAVAERFRAVLADIAVGPDGPSPEPVDLDWRPADPRASTLCSWTTCASLRS